MTDQTETETPHPLASEAQALTLAVGALEAERAAWRESRAAFAVHVLTAGALESVPMPDGIAPENFAAEAARRAGGILQTQRAAEIAKERTATAERNARALKHRVVLCERGANAAADAHWRACEQSARADVLQGLGALLAPWYAARCRLAGNAFEVGAADVAKLARDLGALVESALTSEHREGAIAETLLKAPTLAASAILTADDRRALGQLETPAGFGPRPSRATIEKLESELGQLNYDCQRIETKLGDVGFEIDAINREMRAIEKARDDRKMRADHAAASLKVHDAKRARRSAWQSARRLELMKLGTRAATLEAEIKAARDDLRVQLQLDAA